MAAQSTKTYGNYCPHVELCVYSYQICELYVYSYKIYHGKCMVYHGVLKQVNYGKSWNTMVYLHKGSPVLAIYICIRRTDSIIIFYYFLIFDTLKYIKFKNTTVR